MDRPILFSGPMVRAILEGRKTQTRRVLKQQPIARDVRPNGFFGMTPFFSFTLCDDGGANSSMAVPIPYAIGDRLWVREAFSYDRLDVDRDGTLPPWFWADGNPSDGDWTKPKPSIHMPRWASRLTLIVADVRVQRLQEISEADALAEGCPAQTAEDLAGMEARGWFCDLWDSLNAKRGFGWDANPWVCAVTFDAHQQNIDRTVAA